MSKQRRVSVIVPYYNSKGYIGRLLESVSMQTEKDFQCILVDDGGTDGSYEFVSERIAGDPRFLNLKRPEAYKPGGRGAKNFGYTFSEGELIVFFDSDDVMYPDFLKARADYLTQNPDKDAVLSDYGWKVRPGEYKRTYKYNRELFREFTRKTREDSFWLNYMDYRFFFTPGNAMWRRSSIDDKPLWDETTSIGEDHEYHARLMLAGLDIGLIDGVHWDYMANTNSMIATSESVGPLLSRSHGKMLVTGHLLSHLGHRKDLLRKELTWQVKILRRLVACDSGNSEKNQAVETMFQRIEKVMDMLGYSKSRKSFVMSGLKAIVDWDRKTGKAHRLYTLFVRDKTPTRENEYFTIA